MVAFLNWFGDPNNLIAVSTFIIAAFTIVLGLTCIQQVELTRKSINLVREAFISSNRPRIRVRLLNMKISDGSEPIVIGFTLANIGDIPARIAKIETTFTLKAVIKVASDNFEDFEWTGVSEPSDTIAAGASHTLSEKVPLNYDPKWGIPFQYLGLKTVIKGKISYRDERGVMRTTAFYRMGTDDPNKFAFAELNEAQRRDLEYED
jgi:hypothetical protein